MTEIILAKINSKFNGYSFKQNTSADIFCNWIDLAFKSDS